MKYAFSVILLSLLPVVGNRCTLDETIADTTKEALGVDHRVNPKKRLERKGIIKDEKSD